MARKKKPPASAEWFDGVRPELVPVPALVVYCRAGLTLADWREEGNPCWSIQFAGEGEPAYAMTTVPVCCDLAVPAECPDSFWRVVSAGYAHKTNGNPDWTGNVARCRIIPNARVPVGERITRYGTPQRMAWLLTKERCLELFAPFALNVPLESFALTGEFPDA